MLSLISNKKTKNYAQSGAAVGMALGLMGGLSNAPLNNVSAVKPVLVQTAMGGIAGGLMGGAIGTVMNSMDTLSKADNVKKKKKGDLMELF